MDFSCCLVNKKQQTNKRSKIKELMCIPSCHSTQTEELMYNMSKAVHFVNEAVHPVQRKPFCLIISIRPRPVWVKWESRLSAPATSLQQNLPLNPEQLIWSGSDWSCLNWEVLRQLTFPILSCPDTEPLFSSSSGLQTRSYTMYRQGYLRCPRLELSPSLKLWRPQSTNQQINKQPLTFHAQTLHI